MGCRMAYRPSYKSFDLVIPSGHLPACILATVVAFLSQSGVTGICNLRS